MIIPSGEEHVVLGRTVNSRLNFYSYLKHSRKKAADILNDFTRTGPCINHNQRRIILSSILTEQLSYCPLLWTFCSRQSSHLLNKLQGQAIRTIYNDYDSCFSELSELLESTDRIKNITLLMTGIYKFCNDFWPPIMNDIFQKQENCESIRKRRSQIPKRKFTCTYEIDTISFRGRQI